MSVAADRADELLARARAAGVAASVIGRTGGARLRVAVDGVPVIDVARSEIEAVWAGGLSRYFEGRAA